MSIFISRTACIIGRAKDCNPQLPDDEDHRTISRYHCLLALVEKPEIYFKSANEFKQALLKLF